MNAVLNAPVVADVPMPKFRPGPAGTHITIRGLTKYFAGWPLYEDFDLDIPKHKIVSVFELHTDIIVRRCMGGHSAGKRRQGRSAG